MTDATLPCLYCGKPCEVGEVPCVVLTCDNDACGDTTYHKECIEHWMRRCKQGAGATRAGASRWSSGTTVKTGLNGYVCPRGKGKVQDDAQPCRFHVRNTREIQVITTKGELRKAARIAKLTQQAQQAQQAQKQQVAQKQQAQRQQQAQQAQQPRVANLRPAAAPGWPAQQQQRPPLAAAAPAAPKPQPAAPPPPARPGAHNAIVSAEQREVPGMEFEDASKPQQRRRRKGAAAADGPPLSQQAALPPVLEELEDARESWVTSAEAYERLIAAMSGGDSGGGTASDEPAPYDFCDASRSSAPSDSGFEDVGSERGEWGFGRSSGGGGGEEEWQVWEEPGAVDPLATVTEILAAFGVDVRLASQDSRAERGACLFECLTAIEELQQRGNDLGGLKAVVEEQARLECFDTDFFASGPAVAAPDESQQALPPPPARSPPPLPCPVPVFSSQPPQQQPQLQLPLPAPVFSAQQPQQQPSLPLPVPVSSTPQQPLPLPVPIFSTQQQQQQQQQQQVLPPAFSAPQLSRPAPYAPNGASTQLSHQPQQQDEGGAEDDELLDDLLALCLPAHAP